MWHVASILLRFQIPTLVFKERKGLYSKKRKEFLSEERFVILSRQTQQGIPGKLHCIAQFGAYCRESCATCM